MKATITLSKLTDVTGEWYVVESPRGKQFFTTNSRDGLERAEKCYEETIQFFRTYQEENTLIKKTEI